MSKSLASLLFYLFLTHLVVLGQGLDCPTIVKNALAAADDSCAETGRNEACYGNIILTVEPQSGIRNLVFQQAGDRVRLNQIKSLTLSPLDEANQTWGVALLRVQANLPDTLPGQNVTFLLFGDVQITDAERTGETSQNAQPAAPTVTITVRTSMNLRSGSSTSDSIVTKLSGGQELVADGRNEAGDWLHVEAADGQTGWVFARLVTVNGDSSQLPVTDGNNPATAEAPVPYGPMQAFYFKTAAADAPCTEAPDSGILIQTPQGAAHVNLLVNEVKITLGSTVYLQAQPNADMTIYVVEGQATVSTQGVTVVAPAGTQVKVPMDGNLQANGAPSAAQAYDIAKVSALPIGILPDVIVIAPPTEAVSAESTTEVGGGDALISGAWCPTRTGCTETVLPTTITFTYEDDGAVLTLAYSGGEERYTRTEPGVYTWSQGGTKAVLRVLSAGHFTQEFTFAGGNTTTADWTRQEAKST